MPFHRQIIIATVKVTRSEDMLEIDHFTIFSNQISYIKHLIVDLHLFLIFLRNNFAPDLKYLYLFRRINFSAQVIQISTTQELNGTVKSHPYLIYVFVSVFNNVLFKIGDSLS